MKPTKLTKAHVIQELRGEIKMYRQSYRESDGKVRDPGALRTIDCLEIAIECVRNQPHWSTWTTNHSK
jgi:hypothetical protein